MNKPLPVNYLKIYRERTGFLLQDMASLVDMHVGNLSKIESGQVTPSLEVVLAYYLVFKIPIDKLCKNHIKESLYELLLRSDTLKEELLDTKASKSVYKRLELLDIIIDRLNDEQEVYAEK